jgi:hypothetical protein
MFIAKQFKLQIRPRRGRIETNLEIRHHRSRNKNGTNMFNGIIRYLFIFHSLKIINFKRLHKFYSSNQTFH